MKKYDIVIGIDPGATGAISIKDKDGKISVFKMPKTTNELHGFLVDYSGKENVFCFIEKVGAFVGDDPGKRFGIIKMIEQFKSIKVCLEILKIPYIEIAAVTWQSRLKFKRIKGQSKTDRKRRYTNWAKKWVPGVKILATQGDAVCILACGLKMIENNDPLLGGDIHSQIEELF